MSSQPYVYKPPTKRVAYNPSSKSQILPETGNFDGLKVNKISELGPSSLFQGIDNLQSKSTKTKVTAQQKITPKQEQIKQPINDTSILGLNRFERKQANKLSDQKPTLAQSSSIKVKQQPKQKEQQIEKQPIASINAPLGRKPVVGRTIKQELKDESKEKPILISRKPQMQPQNVQVQEKQPQKAQTSSFMYKPAIKRSSGQFESLNPTTISRNRSQILPKQTYKTQLKSQIINKEPQRRGIYQTKEQKQQSIVDLNLQVNTKRKMFNVQIKKDDNQSAVEKIPTSKSITSLKKIEQPIIKTPSVETNKALETVEKPSLTLPAKNIYGYQRARTKAQLVREIQSKAIQKEKLEDESISATIIEQKKPVHVHTRIQSELLPHAEQQGKLQENKLTTIDNKELKPSPHRFGRKNKEELTTENKQDFGQVKIIVSGEKKEVEKAVGSTYVYQPAMRRTQKFVQETSIKPKEEELKKQDVSGEKCELLIDNKRPQYPSYQRKQVAEDKRQPQQTVTATIKSSPIAFAKQPAKQQLKQQPQPQPQPEPFKQSIPPIAFSLLNILIKKKLSSNIKDSFSVIQSKFQQSIKKQKYLSSLIKKSVSLSTTYINNLQQECFNSLKRTFVTLLSVGQVSTTSPRVTTKALPKTDKQDEQISTIVETMKKPLCYQLSSLVNSKLKVVMKQKLYPLYHQQTYSANKSLLCSSLFNILNTKTSNNLKSAFMKMKFAYSHVQKNNDEDVLTLIETKNKKLSKQQIVKYFQNIYQTQPSQISINRVSLIQKTLQKVKSKVQHRKDINEPTLTKVDTQKVSELKSKIQSLEKQIKEQQKLKKDKQDESNTKKVELKRQIEEMRKQNELRKRENEELKKKLKKFEVISFSDSKQASNEFVTVNKQVESEEKEIPRRGQDEILGVLCSLYVGTMLRKQQSSCELSLQGFMKQCRQKSPLIVQSMNYLTGEQNQQSQDLSQQQHNDYITSMLQRSKLIIEQRKLIEQNMLLRSHIEYVESKMMGEELQPEISKVNDELQAMRSLAKNYIKQRYLWEWVTRSIQNV